MDLRGLSDKTVSDNKMSCPNECSSCVSKSFSNVKLIALESTLHQSIVNFKDIVHEVEHLCLEAEDNKRQFIIQKEKCESMMCNSSETLKKVIESKDKIIGLVASSLSRLQETKNFSIINEIFRILYCETTACKREIVDIIKLERSDSLENVNIKSSPKEQDSIEDVSFKEVSVSEIEGTPGRTSPIIQSRKLLNIQSNNSSDYREKKMCLKEWPTSQNKAVKLCFPSPSRSKGNVRLRQSRINLVKLKTNNVVDLTSSPELMTRNSPADGSVQPLIKKESTDNEDTILPSPTSGSSNFPSLLKTSTKNSPFKRPPLRLKGKSVKDEKNIENSHVTNEVKEESINFLKPLRIKEDIKENSPIKMSEVYEDETHCEITSSLSILQHVDMLEQNQEKRLSPSKRPLEENKNIDNLPPDIDTDSSISLLHRDQIKIKPTEEKVMRKVLENNEPLYKEPTVRKKLEKRALRGWSCVECKNFYAELYKDDVEMLSKKMDECSKHRGKNNPARPKTPDGFWNPRWDVPDDTEEFNRRNNVVR